MDHSGDDILRLLSDFIKGKAGPPGAKFAQLSIPEGADLDFTERPPLSQTYGDLQTEYPVVATGLSRTNRLTNIAAFAGMLTAPELQSNCYRLEVLVHLAAMSQGRKRPTTAAQIAAWFRQLDEGTCGRQEDPAEDIFTSTVSFEGANYVIFEGPAEGNSFYTQLFLHIIEDMPKLDWCLRLREAVRTILKLSNRIASRAGLRPYIQGNTNPIRAFRKPSDDQIAKLKSFVQFTPEDLDELDIHPLSLDIFTIEEEYFGIIKDCAPEFTPLRMKPVIVVGRNYVVSLPTCIGLAIRAQTILFSYEAKSINKLEESIENFYSDLFYREPVLNAPRPPTLGFAKQNGIRSCQIMTEIDPGRYLHIIFFLDDFSGAERGLFLSINDEKTASALVQQSVTAARDSASGRAEFREGHTIIVICGWGRSFACRMPDSTTEWRVEAMAAHDALTLSRHKSFSPLDLYRISSAELAAKDLGIEVFNINGLLNLYSYMDESDGHIVPHEQLDSNFLDTGAAFVQLPQNSLIRVRAEVARSTDIHVAISPEGMPTTVRRLNSTPRYGFNSLSPFYVDIAGLESGKMRCVYERESASTWIETTFISPLDRSTEYQIVQMVNHWAESILRYFDKPSFYQTTGGVITVQFEDSEEPTASDPVPDDEAIARLFDVLIEADSRAAIVKVKKGFIAAARRPDNAGERTLVSALASAYAAFFEGAITRFDQAAATQEIAGDPGARHFHAFTVPDLRDFVRESLRRAPLTISRFDDAHSRLGLGWICRDRSLGGDIEGRQECCDYLNALVKAIGQRLKVEIKQFNRSHLVRALLTNHEACALDAARWRRTFRAVYSLSEDKAKAFGEASTRIAKLNAASLAARIAIEIAISESTTDGGFQPGDYDIGRLLALVSHLFHMGGYSDAVNAAVMPAKIRISPAGDILMDHSFTDQVVRPFGEKLQSLALDEAAQRYADNFLLNDISTDDPASDEVDVDPLDKTFVDAWADEFGYSVENCRSFVEVFRRIAIDQAQAVVSLTQSDLLQKLTEVGPADEARLFLEHFTLNSRAAWDETPTGYAVGDWLPWRFRRRLSIVSRPVLQWTEDADIRCVFAPSMVVHHIAKYVHDLRYGAIDPANFRRNSLMASWIGRVNNEQGRVFNNKIAEAFKELGWISSANLTDGEILSRKSDPNFGDIDVIAWRHSDQRVLIIECKDLSIDKTITEIARRLSRFKGVSDEKGRRDDLKKHLDRCSVLRSEIDGVSKFVGLDSPKIESIVVFSQHTPVMFDMRDPKQDVIFVSQTDIREMFS